MHYLLPLQITINVSDVNRFLKGCVEYNFSNSSSSSELVWSTQIHKAQKGESEFKFRGILVDSESRIVILVDSELFCWLGITTNKGQVRSLVPSNSGQLGITSHNESEFMFRDTGQLVVTSHKGQVWVQVPSYSRLSATQSHKSLRASPSSCSEFLVDPEWSHKARGLVKVSDVSLRIKNSVKTNMYIFAFKVTLIISVTHLWATAPHLTWMHFNAVLFLDPILGWDMCYSSSFQSHYIDDHLVLHLTLLPFNTISLHATTY